CGGSDSAIGGPFLDGFASGAGIAFSVGATTWSAGIGAAACLRGRGDCAGIGPLIEITGASAGNGAAVCLAASPSERGAGFNGPSSGAVFFTSSTVGIAIRSGARLPAGVSGGFSVDFFAGACASGNSTIGGDVFDDDFAEPFFSEGGAGSSGRSM